MNADNRRADLREATLTGVRWISVSRLVTELTALASAIVLARLVPPAEFGHAAVAMIVVALAIVLGPAGLTAPLVQRRSLDGLHTEAAAFLSLGAGLVLTALTYVFAASAGEAIFGNETARLIELASPAWLIVGVGAVSQALLQRELRFRRVALVDATSVLVGAGSAVLLAVLGLDAEAIVLGGLAAALAATAVAIVSAPPALPRPSRRGISEIGGFALPVTLSSVLYSTFRNVDLAILGARVSAADVGYYWRAHQLGVDYQGKVSQVMLRVSFPVYSRSEDLDELRRLRMRIVRVHATVLVPLLAAFVALAPVFVPWLFGAAWEPAVLPAQIMAVAGIGDALLTGTGPLLVAIGRPRVLLLWNACELVFYAAMVFLLAPHGLIAVSIGVAGFAVVAVLLNWILLMHPFVGLPVRQLALEVVPGFVTGVCVVGVLSAARLAFERAGLPTVVVLAVLSLAGLAVYVAVLRVLFAEVWKDLVLIIRRVRGHDPVRLIEDGARAPVTGS